MSDISLNSKKPIKKGIFKSEYLLVVILIVLVCVLFLSNSGVFSLLQTTTTLSQENYETIMEQKLENLISEIDGAGAVSVVLSVDGTTLKEYLKNSQTKTENGVTYLEETTVLINGKPYLVKENYPKVIGVVIVCQGAENVKVKMAITEVITTVLSVSSENIRILKKK